MAEQARGGGAGPKHGHATSGAAVSGVWDATAAAFDAALTTAKDSQLARGDPRVSTAFALGWQMAELYRPDARRRASPRPGHLPGLSSLTAAEWRDIGLDQLQAGLAKLRGSIEDVGLEVPKVDALRTTLAKLADPIERGKSIRAFHVNLLCTLIAADYRLGKSYGLGRALADTTREPPDYKAELDTGRVNTLCAWVRDLDTAFPPHSARAVADSLEAWSEWAKDRPGGDPGDPTVRKLRAQGRLWRSMLSGEKRATDMLETLDFVHAAEGMVQRTGRLVRDFLKHYGWLVALIVALFLGGVAAMAVFGNPAAIASGAAAVIASIGISWKGVGSSLGRGLARVEDPLWGAELDDVIYSRITPEEVFEARGRRAIGPDEPSLVADR
ncbi:MAG: hypothetical protein JO321_04450 [Solirubrobacterales bacterium]|nr:hypothetical protein [Solirubrobacterales bacterium]MBV9534648.1 hypothetical protein [Solirubrobacterales bacterium]